MMLLARSLSLLLFSLSLVNTASAEEIFRLNRWPPL